jgi:hypothetical protein
VLFRSTHVVCLFLLCAFAVLTGCATIFSGTADEITVNSHPGDASVKIKAPNGNVVAEGNTPMSIDLRRGKTYTVIVSREGYSPATATIMNGGIVKSFWLNVFTGVVVGWAVDYLSGAMFNFDSTSINVHLKESTSLDGTAEIYAVLTFLGVDGKQKSISTKMEPVRVSTK